MAELDREYFGKVISVVINKLEGGYFHPDMRTNNPKKFGPYHRSGETMFGLDRHAGHGLYYSNSRKADDVIENLKYIYDGSYKYKSDDAKKFWSKIDAANARTNWKWLYRGGNLEAELTKYAGNIMYPQFLKLAKSYLSDAARPEV